MPRKRAQSLGVSRRAALGGAAAALSAAAWRRAPGANERIGVGFVGFGLIGKRHVLDFAEQPDAEIVAVADVHRGRMEEGRSLAGGEIALEIGSELENLGGVRRREIVEGDEVFHGDNR